MGTNYFARIGPDRCEACGREFDLIHLGKASAGWVFAFRWQPEHYLDFVTFTAFVTRPDVIVSDETGDRQDPVEFLDMIEAKQKVPGARRHANLESSPTMKSAYPVTTIDGYEFCDYDFS